MTPAEFHAWRGRLHWTQAQAAEALGVDPRTVREWEHGVGRMTGQPITLPPMLALACEALSARAELSSNP